MRCEGVSFTATKLSQMLLHALCESLLLGVERRIFFFPSNVDSLVHNFGETVRTRHPFSRCATLSLLFQLLDDLLLACGLFVGDFGRTEYTVCGGLDGC